ncbi:hypothetical protein COU17_00785 [Candidatus Kaiserbacteria bacterium CG10_big_fil_rev_8_21_14_0_10_49_17]|uniref:Ig-like domain-containing protein n=1 Tax=Candidatus Kaiserbacteria bacterium CG10_big_fil_rev_8_21_14_0_10_49_17 TaxID=1974609 RepID=A0A2M6WEZ7_9BACT|nr:MAG: hypothetical protein COU17_00785 [Candidatus Kaiserbacteria bacterium CG10_big_fil_rev_8_21_14_0_10_49_17]
MTLFALGALVIALSVAIDTGTTGSMREAGQTSVEVGVAATSPHGDGYVIPASCGSPHTGDLCTPPTFNCSPDAINEGAAITCSWQCDSSTSSAGVNFSTGGATSGSVNLTPNTSTTYTVQCSNGGQASESVTVLNPDLSITATPVQVRFGDTSTIVWEATEVNSCSVTGPNFSASGTSGSQGTGSVTQESTYTLSCSTDGGTVSESVTIRLIPAFEEF